MFAAAHCLSLWRPRTGLFLCGHWLLTAVASLVVARGLWAQGPWHTGPGTQALAHGPWHTGRGPRALTHGLWHTGSGTRALGTQALAHRLWHMGSQGPRHTGRDQTRVPALTGGLLTTGPTGKPQFFFSPHIFFFSSHIFNVKNKGGKI